MNWVRKVPYIETKDKEKTTEKEKQKKPSSKATTPPKVVIGIGIEIEKAWLTLDHRSHRFGLNLK